MSDFIFTSSGPFKGMISWCNCSRCLFDSTFIVFYYFFLALGLYCDCARKPTRKISHAGFHICMCTHPAVRDFTVRRSTTDCLMDWFNKWMNEYISNEVAETAAWRQLDKWTSQGSKFHLSLWPLRQAQTAAAGGQTLRDWSISGVRTAGSSSILSHLIKKTPAVWFCSNQADALLCKRSDKCHILTFTIVSSTAKMLLFSFCALFWGGF